MRRRRNDEDFKHEIDAHIALETDRLIAEGLDPDEARQTALRAFGNRTRAEERFYESGRTIWLDQLAQDVRHAWRTFLRTPGFTAAAVTTLALGIGANTAIFSVVYAVLLRPLPYASTDRLVRVVETIAPRVGSSGPTRRTAPVGAADLTALRSRARTLSHAGIHIPVFWTLTERGESSRVVGARVSPDLLLAFEVSPDLGRLFEADEENDGRDAVILLSHQMWQQRYGGESSVLGRSITLEGRDYSVVGVMPARFQFPDATTGFWVPFVAPRAGPRAQQRLPLTARIRDGVSPDEALTELTALLPQVRSDPAPPNAPPPVLTLSPLIDLVVAPVRPALTVLMGAVGLVLLIACVNVANLLLARSHARRRDHAIRTALGAGRGRLARQAVTESLVLATLGGLAGIVLAFGGLQLLRMLAGGLARRDLGPSTALPRLDEIGIDGTVWLYTIALSAATGLVFAALPALGRSQIQPGQFLRDSGGSGVSGFSLLRGQRMHGLLIVTEVAMAMVLFVGAGLLTRSFANLATVKLGFEPANVLTFQLSLPPARSEPELKALGELVSERLRATESVVAVGYTESLPMIPSGRMVPLRSTPDPPPLSPLPPAFGPARPDLADGRVVSHDYLRAIGIRIIEGRGFEDSDRAGQPRALLINRRLARSGLLGEKPVGQQIYAIGREPYQVVGVFEDVRQFSVSVEPEQQVLMNMRQVIEPLNLSLGLYFAIRVEGSSVPLTSALPGVIRQLDSQAMVENIRPMAELVSYSTSRQRLYAVLMGIFAGVAVALAAIGIYGVLVYAVVQRTREIGIRMALGAEAWTTIALICRQAAVLVALGLAIGVAVAVSLSRWLEGLLFGLTAFDAVTFVAVASLFAIVAALAAVGPARRATRVDPVTALREG
jgi:putative ABC transport system permease protein